SQPIPWRASECSRAATLHLGGTLDEIAASEQQVFDGKHSDQPYVLLAQQSLFDPTRAPVRPREIATKPPLPLGEGAGRSPAGEGLQVRSASEVPGHQEIPLPL